MPISTHDNPALTLSWPPHCDDQCQGQRLACHLVAQECLPIIMPPPSVSFTSAGLAGLCPTADRGVPCATGTPVGSAVTACCATRALAARPAGSSRRTTLSVTTLCAQRARNLTAALCTVRGQGNFIHALAEWANAVAPERSQPPDSRAVCARAGRATSATRWRSGRTLCGQSARSLTAGSRACGF